VQAAIGAVPLLTMQAAGLPSGPGEVILAVAVLSIVVTAPAGAWLSARLADRVLHPAAA
jgi:solute carrier family 9B (sodium/hydrogen exchanger), member 1/2